MSSGDLPFLSAAATAQAMRSKQVSPVDVVQAYLERIERFDSTLHAYITVLREEALSAARQAEQVADTWGERRAVVWRTRGGEGSISDQRRADDQRLAGVSRFCAD